MPKKTQTSTTEGELDIDTQGAAPDAAERIASAIAAAIESARPVKITTSNRKKNTPWTPKDGEARLKLKRRLYQHSMLIVEERLTNEQIALANQLRPGTYFGGFINVIRRRDKGIDIDYPFKKTNRNKLQTSFGITTFTELLKRLVDEGLKPKVAFQDEVD